MQRNYAVSVRLSAEDERQVSETDSPNFGQGMYPTSRWVPGEVVCDYVELASPATLPAGRYQIGIIIFENLAHGNWRNLALPPDGQETAYLRSLNLPFQP
jgi:hypothetical protein